MLPQPNPYVKCMVDRCMRNTWSIRRSCCSKKCRLSLKYGTLAPKPKLTTNPAIPTSVAIELGEGHVTNARQTWLHMTIVKDKLQDCGTPRIQLQQLLVPWALVSGSVVENLFAHCSVVNTTFNVWAWSRVDEDDCCYPSVKEQQMYQWIRSVRKNKLATNTATDHNGGLCATHFWIVRLHD
jgi:hypothetical protein